MSDRPEGIARLEVIALVRRLRRYADEVVTEGPLTLTRRNAAVVMLDAAYTLVDYLLDGLEPGDGPTGAEEGEEA